MGARDRRQGQDGYPGPILSQRIEQMRKEAMETTVTARPRPRHSSRFRTGLWRTTLGVLGSLIALAVIGASYCPRLGVSQKSCPPEYC